jgi:hypothetical protein
VANSRVSAAPGRTVPSCAARALERPERGRADGDDPAASAPHLADQPRRRLRDLVPLGVHAVVADVLGLHRREGAGPDVQRDEGAPDAALVEAGQELGREVERRPSAPPPPPRARAKTGW